MVDLLQTLNKEMAAIIDSVRCSLVQINNGRSGRGAGTIWHSDGLILTNAHVIAPHRGRPGTISITLPDGRLLPARLLATDPALDLAALAVTATELPMISLGRSRRLRPGQWVIAVGHPWGVLGAVTAGTIIQVGPHSELAHYRGDLIQAALHLRPGHSGGPMVDAHGRLVGINTMIAGPDVGLAVPLYTVKQFLRRSIGT